VAVCLDEMSNNSTGVPAKMSEQRDDKKHFKIYPKEIQQLIIIFGLIAATFAGACVGFGIATPRECYPLTKKSILIVWTLGVPVWFAIEFWFIYRKKSLPDTFEKFKHSQELTSKIWLAVLGVLVLLYTGAMKLD